jgi:hypothetical protein
MLQSVFNTTISISRRPAVGVASRDILNNPIYGVPTTAPYWQTIYSAVPARLAFSAKPIEFASTAERITPNGVIYIPADYTVYHEDRALTIDGIEYVVVSVVPGYVLNNVIDHWELQVALP